MKQKKRMQECVKTPFPKGGWNPQSLDRQVPKEKSHKHSGKHSDPEHKLQDHWQNQIQHPQWKWKADLKSSKKPRLQWWEMKQPRQTGTSGTELVQSAEFCAELGLIVPYIKGKIYILAIQSFQIYSLTYSCVHQQYAYSDTGIMKPEPGSFLSRPQKWFNFFLEKKKFLLPLSPYNRENRDRDLKIFDWWLR